MAVETRKAIHDKLVTNFAALKHVNNTDVLFSEVKKFYLDFPTSLPSCQIIAASPSVITQGISHDTRVLTFTAIIYELLEIESSESEVERKMDRLEDIEDQVFNYLQKIPNPIEHSITGVHVFRLEVSSSRYDYEISENGLRVYLTIDFNCHITIDVKNL